MKRTTTEKFKIPESIRVPYLGGILYKFFVKQDNKSIAREALPENPLNKEPREETVTVSLTSFPSRIDKVHLAIKSLMLQSYKPDRIILWLAKEQFPDRILPQELLNMEKYGLEIRYCDHDILGHKKHCKAIEEQKENELVLTYDDDIIYPPDSIEKLINTHKKFPECIICNRSQTIIYKNGEIENPGRWQTISDEGLNEPTYMLLPSNGGGVLYPYKSLCEDSYNVDKINKLSLRADDLWMMFMALAKGTKTVKTAKYTKPFSVISDSQEIQLATNNIYNNAYLDFLANLQTEYPDGWALTQNK